MRSLLVPFRFVPIKMEVHGFTTYWGLGRGQATGCIPFQLQLVQLSVPGTNYTMHGLYATGTGHGDGGGGWGGGLVASLLHAVVTVLSL